MDSNKKCIYILFIVAYRKWLKYHILYNCVWIQNENLNFIKLVQNKKQQILFNVFYY